MIANRDAIESLETDDRSPGERDLQIYAAVRVDGRRQVEVAAELGITQGRVSQIVSSVQRWRVGMGWEAELERRDRRSVDRWLTQLRIEKLYEETMELFRRSREPRRTERRGKNQHGEWSSQTLDHQPGNLQCLKFAGRLLGLGRQLDQDPPPSEQSPRSPRSQLDEYEAFRLLVEMRDDAMRRGDVPEGENSEYVVERMMNALTGREEHVSPRERAARQAREAEVNAAAACLMDQPPGVANTGAVISDISGVEAVEQVALVGASDCAEGACVTAPIRHAANNNQIFSRDVRAAREETVPAWPPDEEPPPDKEPPAAWPQRQGLAGPAG